MMFHARCKKALWCFALGLGILAAGRARADLTLYDKDGWTLKHGGLAQGFYVLTTGDTAPTGGTAAPIRFDFLDTGVGGGDANNSFVSSRFRSGWTGGRFNWVAAKKMSDTMTASAHLGVAFSISTYNAPPASNNLWDVRNGYLEIEAPWGDLLVGRNVGLYTLGSIISEATMTSAPMGLGNSCGVSGDGLSCYEAGYGVKFPGFWAGVFYTTPNLNGLKIKVALLDPEKVGSDVSAMVGGAQIPISQQWAKTPLPMVQTLITYEKAMGSLTLKPFFNGFWEQVGLTNTSRTLNPMGGGAGLDVYVGPLKVGAGGTLEKGTSMYGPLFGNDPIDGAGQLRNGYSFYAHALCTVGKFDVAAGYGQAGITRSANDLANNLNINKNQSNIHASLQYNMDPLAFVAEINHIKHQWVLGNTQTVDFFVLGANFSY